MNYKLTPSMIARAFEEIDKGVQLKAIAVDLGVDISSLCRKINRAEAEGFAAFPDRFDVSEFGVSRKKGEA